MESDVGYTEYKLLEFYRCTLPELGKIRRKSPDTLNFIIQMMNHIASEQEKERKRQEQKSRRRAIRR